MLRRRRRCVLAASIYLQPTPAGRCRTGIRLLVHPLLPPGSSDICDINTPFREHEGCPPSVLLPMLLFIVRRYPVNSPLVQPHPLTSAPFEIMRSFLARSASPSNSPYLGHYSQLSCRFVCFGGARISRSLHFSLVLFRRRVGGEELYSSRCVRWGLSPLIGVGSWEVLVAVMVRRRIC